MMPRLAVLGSRAMGVPRLPVRPACVASIAGPPLLAAVSRSRCIFPTDGCTDVHAAEICRGCPSPVAGCWLLLLLLLLLLNPAAACLPKTSCSFLLLLSEEVEGQVGLD